ncbi:MAG: GAF domain-containing sensor histidine kinase [Actinomycetota bacterium]
MRDPSTAILEETRLLLDLSREVTSSLDLQQVLDKSLAGLRRLIPFGGGSIQLVAEDGLALAAADPPAPPAAYELRVPLGEGIGGRIAGSGEPIYVADVDTDDRVPPPSRRALSRGVRSYFGVPLILQGHPIGIVQLDSPEVDGFPPESRALLLTFAPTIAAAVQNAQVFAREMSTISELRAAQQMKSDFLAMVSHELRTPLTTLTGFSELLAARAGTLSPELVAEFGQRMWRASRWLLRMIGDLLDLSQIERGTLVLDMRAIDVEAVIREVTSIDVRDERPIRILNRQEVPYVEADPGRLSQVLGNLLSNARKFSPPAAPIELETAYRAGRVGITVRDHGRGIARDQLGRIFDAFVQGDEATTREAGGMGTGLYIVKNLCDRMGATVEVESDLGVGSTFTVWLRAIEPVPFAAPASTP